MGTRTISLVHEVTFSQVRPQWPAPIRGDSHSACPLCRNRSWRIYEDRVAGEWASCLSCRFAGDPIEWTAKIAKLNIWQTLHAFKEYGIIDVNVSPKAIGRYMRDHVGYRRKISALWGRSLQDLSMRSREHLTDSQADVFRDRCSGRESVAMGIAGVTKSLDVEAVFHPRSVAPQFRLNRDGIRTKRRGSGAGASRIFVGPNWGDLTTIAFEDLPGRISGFYFRQPEDEESEGKSRFYAVPHAPGNQAVREAGLAMLTLSLNSTTPNYAGWAFIVHDAVRAAEIQTHALTHCQGPLPVFGSYADKKSVSDEVYRCLAPRKLVFWSPTAAGYPACLKQCCRAQGSIVLPSVTERLADEHGYFLLNSLRHLAMPWDKALRYELARLPPAQAAAYLDDLQLPGDVHNRFLHQSRELFVKRLHDAPDSIAGYFRKETIAGTIVEHSDGWFDGITHERKLDAQIRIDELRDSTDGEEFVTGRLRLPDSEVFDFDEPLRKIKNCGLLKTLNQVLKKAGREKLKAASKVNALAFGIATAIHPPRRRHLADVVGVRNMTRLHLKKFTIALGGRVEVQDDPFIAADAPAADFPHPIPLPGIALEFLSRQHREQRIFWGMAACIAHNVLATFGGWKPKGIGLVGQGAGIVGRDAAGFLGCRELFPAPTCPPARFVRQITAAGARHGWPVFVGTEQMTRWPTCRKAWLADNRPKNAIVQLSAEAELPDSDWLVLKSDYHSDEIRWLKPWAPHVLTGYFQDVFRRHGDFGPSSGVPIHRILVDMARWFERAGGDPKIVLLAGHLLGFERSDFGLD